MEIKRAPYYWKKLKSVMLSWAVIWKTHISKFNYSDLDFDPSTLEFTVDLCVIALHLHMKNNLNLWSLPEEIICKTFFAIFTMVTLTWASLHPNLTRMSCCTKIDYIQHPFQEKSSGNHVFLFIVTVTLTLTQVSPYSYLACFIMLHLHTKII